MWTLFRLCAGLGWLIVCVNAFRNRMTAFDRILTATAFGVLAILALVGGASEVFEALVKWTS